MYENASRATWVADTSAVRFQESLSDAEKRFELATVLMWGGYAHFLLADNYSELSFHGAPAVTPGQGRPGIDALRNRQLEWEANPSLQRGSSVA